MEGNSNRLSLFGYVLFSENSWRGEGGILSGHFKLSLNAKPILLTQTNLGALATKIEG